MRLASCIPQNRRSGKQTVIKSCLQIFWLNLSRNTNLIKNIMQVWVASSELVSSIKSYDMPLACAGFSYFTTRKQFQSNFTREQRTGFKKRWVNIEHIWVVEKKAVHCKFMLIVEYFYEIYGKKICGRAICVHYI